MFFSDLKLSAKHLLLDLDKRTTEDKIKRFLNNIILDQQYSGIPTRYRILPKLSPKCSTKDVVPIRLEMCGVGANTEHFLSLRTVPVSSCFI